MLYMGGGCPRGGQLGGGASIRFSSRDTVCKGRNGMARTGSASTAMTPAQIAAMASINTLYEEIGDSLLVVGGYGIDPDGDYVTFDTLRVIDVPGTIGWISGDGTLLSEHVTFLDPPKNTPAALADDFFTITGGIMLKNNDELWLCLGQSFQGG